MPHLEPGESWTECVERLTARAEKAERANGEVALLLAQREDEITRLRAAVEQAERQAEADKTMYAEREERLWSELNTMNRQHVASARQMADLGREIERLKRKNPPAP